MSSRISYKNRDTILYIQDPNLYPQSVPAFSFLTAQVIDLQD